MSDRTAILSRVRRATPRRVPHPGRYAPPALPGSWQAFGQSLEAAGGAAHGPFARGELGTRTRAVIAAWDAAGRIVGEEQATTLLGAGPWETARDVARPQSFADVAVGIVPGSVGVAENGAVAVERALAPHRALHFLCERLLLLLPAEALVPDMHAAQDWLAEHGRSPEQLVWISGPSKTADIEQALVYGAHGPLSLAVLAHR